METMINIENREIKSEGDACLMFIDRKGNDMMDVGR